MCIRDSSYYSESLITSYEEFYANALGNDGYTFAEIEGVPTIDEDNNTADITFVFNPGRKNYTRRILFNGNYFTTDEVLRREMRQFEGAPASNQLIEQSKLLLERTGYFKSVNVETVPVAGEEDLVDVIFDVEEQQYGNIIAGFGYSQFGFSFNFNVQQQNFLGSGNTVGIGTQISDYSTNIFLQYENPYYTVDGASRGYSLNFREFDYSSFGLTDYNTASYGGAVSFGFPISEIQRIGFGLGYEYLELNLGDYVSSQIIEDFVSANGNWFKSVNFNLNWVKSTLNRGIFATRGTSQRVGLDLSMPGSGLEYYKITYKGSHLRGMGKQLSLRLRADLGYGESYGDTTQMPFFKNFYSGGLGSVRGYKKYTLGPRNLPQGGFYSYSRPTGGNVQIVLGADVIFPLPFVKDQRSLQSSFFIDAGNIFNTKCGSSQINCFSIEEGELRYSVGVGATWLSGFGPITFSIAKPLNSQPGDETEVFQFSLGNQF